MLLTEPYRALLQALHEKESGFGCSAEIRAKDILRLAKLRGFRSVLDYGCGKRKLEEALKDSGVAVTPYDPAIPECSALPEPHDFVACVDVLEHVEPDCLDEVLLDLRRLTLRTAYVTICHIPSKRILGDFRNAHLIVKDRVWWLDRLTQAGFAVSWHSKPQDKTSVCVLV